MMVDPTRVISKHILMQSGAALAALALFKPAFAAPDDARWPHVRIPPQVETFDVGQETIVDGAPVRMRGFVSTATPAALATSFRQVLGKPLMEDRRGNTLMLGRREGQFYMTVQLDPVGSGTRGTIAVTRPPVDKEDADVARRLLPALPPGSTLASHTTSIDGDIRADHDAIVNSHSIGVNNEYVQRLLRAEGFILERDFTPPRGAGQGARSRVTASARTLFFKGPNAEAIAVLSSDSVGRSVIVLNRVTFARNAK